MSFSDKTTRIFLDEIAAKQPTPGGGSVACVAAAQACSLAEMAGQYTTGDQWADRAERVDAFLADMKEGREAFMQLADADAVAYKELQQSWRDKDMPDNIRERIEEKALEIPFSVVLACEEIAGKVETFLKDCNPRILSDAKAALHLIAGAAHAAYHTAVVNKPSPAQQNDLQDSLAKIRIAEQSALRL